MQRVEESSSRAIQPERSGLKPTTAFLLLLSGAVAVAGVLYLTRPEPAPSPTTTTTTTTKPNFALTDSEAIARFEELAEIRARAYSSHDPTLLNSLYTDDSVVRSIAAKELRRLNKDGVSDVSIYDTKQLTVLSNEPTQIRLEEVVVVTPKFVDANGRNVTEAGPAAREVVLWTLQLEGGVWLVDDALITKSTPVKT